MDTGPEKHVRKNQCGTDPCKEQQVQHKWEEPSHIDKESGAYPSGQREMIHLEGEWCKRAGDEQIGCGILQNNKSAQPEVDHTWCGIAVDEHPKHKVANYHNATKG